MRNTILVAVMVLLVLATPVVLLLKQATEDELQSRLAASASAISSTLAPQLLSGSQILPSDLIDMVPPSDHVEIFNASGKLIVVYGPTAADAFHGSSSGPSGTRIDVSTSGHDARQRTTRQLLLLGVLAAGGVLLAAVLAAIFGARVSRPLEQLAASAARLGRWLPRGGHPELAGPHG